MKLLQTGIVHQPTTKSSNKTKILKSRPNVDEKIKLIEPVESRKNAKVEVFALTQAKAVNVTNKNEHLKKKHLKSKPSSFVVHSP